MNRKMKQEVTNTLYVSIVAAFCLGGLVVSYWVLKDEVVPGWLVAATAFTATLVLYAATMVSKLLEKLN